MKICSSCHKQIEADAKYCPDCGVPQPTGRPAQHARKRVTVLFTDVVGSTALGRRLLAESLDSVLHRFFDEAREVVERRAGVFQRPVGDAVMATFGLPDVQTDDALHAVQAAVDIHGMMPELNQELSREWGVELSLHTAINTGDVVVEEGGSRLETAADHVNLAAALVKRAEPHEILLAPATFNLVRASVRAVEVPTQIQGLDGRFFKLVDLSEQRGAFHTSLVPMIGREWELDFLRLLYKRVLHRRKCILVPVFGDAGVGKTRLLNEFLRDLAQRQEVLERPQVLRGSPPSPAADSTHHPIRQMIRQAAEIRAETPEEQARERLSKLVGGDEGVVARLAPFIGAQADAAHPEETIGAICRTLAVIASRAPLVMIIDDLHLAKEPLLAVLERVKDTLTTSPILLVIVSRPELTDATQRSWASWVKNTDAFEVEPFEKNETEEMVKQLLAGASADDKVVGEIVKEAGGIPLDVEELVRSLQDSDVLRVEDHRWVLSGDVGEAITLPEAFTVRIDRLPETERTVASRAAVIGDRFSPSEVAALMPESEREATITTLNRLVRMELLKLHRSAGGAYDPKDEVHSFWHNRYEQAAYNRLPLPGRAALHEQFATWLERERDQGELPSTAERIAHHLQTSHDYMVGLRGEGARQAGDLRRRTADWHVRTAQRYITSGMFPIPSATDALRQAARMYPEGSREKLRALLDLADTMQEPDPTEARTIYERVELAAKDDHPAIASHAAFGRLELAWFHGAQIDWGAESGHIEEMIRGFEQGSSDATTHLMAKAYRLLAHAKAGMGAADDAVAAADRAVELIQQTGDTRLHAKIVRLRLVTMFWGSRHVEKVVREIETSKGWAQTKGLRLLEVACLGLLARAAAWRGQFDQARSFNEQAKAKSPGTTDMLTAGARCISEATVELLSGKFEDAAKIVRDGLNDLRQAPSTRANLSALMARILIVLGEDNEAEIYIRQSRDHAMPAQLDVQIKWRHLRGLVLARRGELDEAEALCREAVNLSERSQQPVSQAEAYYDLADVLRMQGKFAEADGVATVSLELYTRKGHRISADSTRELSRRIAEVRG